MFGSGSSNRARLTRGAAGFWRSLDTNARIGFKFAPRMLNDAQYLKRQFQLSQIEHRYGENVHILSDAYLFTTLARLCRPDCRQPMINQLLNTLYRELVKVVVNREFPLMETQLDTRMLSLHPEGSFRGLVVDPRTKVVCV